METIHGNWVGCGTVLYNERTGAVSKSINEVIDYINLEIDPHGLAAYFDYGYVVFGRKPVKHVKYLLPPESLNASKGKLVVTEHSDQVLVGFGKPSQEADVLDKMEDRINRWANSFQEDILIPTSGGFDSRLLNILVKDRSRIRAYTYGTSYDQQQSRE